MKYKSRQTHCRLPKMMETCPGEKSLVPTTHSRYCSKGPSLEQSWDVQGALVTEMLHWSSNQTGILVIMTSVTPCYFSCSKRTEFLMMHLEMTQFILCLNEKVFQKDFLCCEESESNCSLIFACLN